MSDARAEILRSIRSALAASAAHEAARPAPPAPHSGPRASTGLPVLAGASAPPVVPPSPAGFVERATAAGAEVHIVTSEAAAVERVAAVLSAAGAQRIAVSDAPLAGAAGRALRAAGNVSVLDCPDAAAIFGCDAGVTEAQAGIHESGTLVLESGAERHRLASLVPPVHVVLLPAERLCSTLGEALGRVAEAVENGVPRHRAVTFITGPSRTADIELTLAIGVHGPQALHVLLIDPDGASAP